MKVAIGQDSHRIDYKNTEKKLILGGIEFENEFSLQANSDGDVILHAITNAISGITCVNILGDKADQMCKNGILDSEEYLKEALKYLKEKIVHISISIECKTPKITITKAINFINPFSLPENTEAIGPFSEHNNCIVNKAK